MKRPGLVLAAFAASIAIFSAISTAAGAAPCYSSTSTSVTVPDSAFDADAGLSPEITSASIAADSACKLSVGYAVAGQSVPFYDDFYIWYFDTDNNPLTGSADGAEMAVGLDYFGAELVRYSGTWTFVRTLGKTGPFGAALNVGDLNVASPVTMGYFGVGLWTDTDTMTDYVDFVPEPYDPVVPVSLAFSSTPPPPPPPPPVVTPTRYCHVPNVKGLSVASATRNLVQNGCKLGAIIKRKSLRYNKRVITTQPGRNAVLAYGSSVDLIVGKKKKKKRARRSRAAAGTTTPVTSRLNAIDSVRR